MASNFVEVEAVFDNPKAVRALSRVMHLAAEIAEDQPWNDQAKELVRAAAYALRHVQVVINANGAVELFDEPH